MKYLCIILYYFIINNTNTLCKHLFETLTTTCLTSVVTIDCFINVSLQILACDRVINTLNHSLQCCPETLDSVGKITTLNILFSAVIYYLVSIFISLDSIV